MVQQGIDLSLLGSFSTRFRVYLLACQQMQFHRRRLDVVAARGVVNVARCHVLFEAALKSFLDGCTEPSSVGAAMEFQEKLAGAFSRSERRGNPRAVAVFDQIGQTMVEIMAGCTPESHLQVIHADAREIARRFFAASPYQETHERLARVCPIRVYYESNPSHALMAHTKHPNGDEIPTHAGTILLPFNKEKTYQSFLQYPFLFVHEYTAHAFAIDHGPDNENFNDGWMLYGAYAFFSNEVSASSGGCPFNWRHLHASEGGLTAVPQGRASDAIGKTTTFYNWITKDHPGWFERITFDLAAFRPSQGEEGTWPRTVLSQLFHYYEYDRSWLAEQVNAVQSARELLQRLSPVAFADEP